MSFYLAVWEGPQPVSDKAALSAFNRLREAQAGPPTEKIRTFITAITEVYPDITNLPRDEIDSGVWSDGPLINNAKGPFFYFGIVWSRAEEVTALIAEIAAKQALVCFYPQAERLAPWPRQ